MGYAQVFGALNRFRGETTLFIAVTTRHAWSDAAGRDFSGRHIAG
jgi:hypothetical protein